MENPCFSWESSCPTEFSGHGAIMELSDLSGGLLSTCGCWSPVPGRKNQLMEWGRVVWFGVDGEIYVYKAINELDIHIIMCIYIYISYRKKKQHRDGSEIRSTHQLRLVGT